MARFARVPDLYDPLAVGIAFDETGNQLLIFGGALSGTSDRDNTLWSLDYLLD